MHYAFDAWMAREFPAVRFERYCDDAVVHCASEQQARQVRDAIAGRLAEVGLELHPQYVLENGVDFAHFKFVHDTPIVPVFTRHDFDDPVSYVRHGGSAGLAHLAPDHPVWLRFAKAMSSTARLAAKRVAVSDHFVLHGGGAADRKRLVVAVRADGVGVTGDHDAHRTQRLGRRDSLGDRALRFRLARVL